MHCQAARSEFAAPRLSSTRSGAKPSALRMASRSLSGTSAPITRRNSARVSVIFFFRRGRRRVRPGRAAARHLRLARTTTPGSWCCRRTPGHRRRADPVQDEPDPGHPARGGRAAALPGGAVGQRPLDDQARVPAAARHGRGSTCSSSTSRATWPTRGQLRRWTNCGRRRCTSRCSAATRPRRCGHPAHPGRPARRSQADGGTGRDAGGGRGRRGARGPPLPAVQAGRPGSPAG